MFTGEIFTSLRCEAQCAEVEPEHGPFYMLNYHRDRLVEAARYFGFQEARERCEGEQGLAWLRESLERAVEDWRRENGDEGCGSAEDALAIRVVFPSTGGMRTEMRRVAPASRQALYPTSLPPPSPDSQQHYSSSSAAAPKPSRPSPLTGGASHASSPASPAGPPRPTWHLTLDTQATPSGPLSVFKTLERQVYTDAAARVLPEARREHGQFAAERHDVLLFDRLGRVSECARCTPYFWRDGGWVTPRVSAAAAPAAEMRGGNRGSTRRWALDRGLCREGWIEKEDLRAGETCWVSNGVRGFALAVLGGGGGLAAAGREDRSACSV